MMADDQNDIMLIDRFLSDDLNSEERNAFNKKLEDPAFKKLFADEKIVRLGIEYSTLKNISSELQDLEASLPEVEINLAKERKLIPWNNNAFKIAASLLLLVAASYVIYRYTKQPDLKLAFENNFEAYPNEFYIPKRGEVTPENNKTKAFEYYDAKQYKDALIYFDRLTASDKDNIINFYEGNAYLATGESEKAIKIFKNLIKDQKFIFIDQCKWYLGLAYLKTQRIADAKKIFSELKEGQSTHRERATEILEELNF
jgi:tetratricopeptide (TPR) repeat protein